MIKEKQYQERDAYELDCSGAVDNPYYSIHVSAMTSEKLHCKDDIAAELAVRDAHIEYLLGLVEKYSGTKPEDTYAMLPQFTIGENY